MRLLRVERPHWFAQAVCRNPGDDQARAAAIARHFPTKGRTAGPARQECAGCPVRKPCLDMALDDPSLVGIWGGTSETERDQLRWRRRTA